MVKPKGPRYRNLELRRGVIYIVKTSTDEDSPGEGWQQSGNRWRFRRSCMTADWDEAAAIRDLWEKGEQARYDGRTPLTFRQAARQYKDFTKPVYKDGVRESGLAETTWKDLDTYLRDDGPLMGTFADVALEAITPEMLRGWWQAQPWKSPATGRQYVNVMSNIFKLARTEQRIDEMHDPLRPFREWLSFKFKGQKKGAKINPIEDPRDIEELLAAAVEEGHHTFCFVLLMLDAGLRQGEAMALRWEDIGWGRGPDDRGRHIHVVRSLSRGTVEKEPKSEKGTRKVPMSRRLWWALKSLERELNPEPTDRIAGRVEPASWRRREWKRILTRVGLPTGKGSNTPKDLRDCFASHLLTAGVPLERIQKYLGHSSVKVTETHYARWVKDDEEVEAFRLEPGEVRPDFLARLCVPHRVPHRDNSVSPAARAILSILEGKEVVELGGLEPPTLRLPA